MYHSSVSSKVQTGKCLGTLNLIVKTFARCQLSIAEARDRIFLRHKLCQVLLVASSQVSPPKAPAVAFEHPHEKYIEVGGTITQGGTNNQNCSFIIGLTTIPRCNGQPCFLSNTMFLLPVKISLLIQLRGSTWPAKSWGWGLCGRDRAMPGFQIGALVLRIWKRSILQARAKKQNTCSYDACNSRVEWHQHMHRKSMWNTWIDV